MDRAPTRNATQMAALQELICAVVLLARLGKKGQRRYGLKFGGIVLR